MFFVALFILVGVIQVLKEEGAKGVKRSPTLSRK
jgi:hypothetical protein